MANNNSGGLGLRQTKGAFQVRGIVTGTDKNTFYKEGSFEYNNKKVNYRSVNFGVQYDENSTLYVNLMGNEKEKVSFYNGKAEGDKKTKKVDWADRHKPQEEGYRLMGTRVGLSKIVNEKGEEVNDSQTLVEYDAAKVIGDNLEDNASVFVNGSIEYSTYNDKHQTKFNIGQVSLCKNPVDFESEDFTPENKFKQEIIFMNIAPNKEVEGEYILSAKTVGYKTIEDIELYVRDKSLAQTFRKALKPYTMIEVGGYIFTEIPIEEVSTDMWGAGIEMNKVKSPVQRKLVVNGADPTTIDTDTYSETVIEEAIAKMRAEAKAKEDYGSKNKWGNLNSDDFDGEEWD